MSNQTEEPRFYLDEDNSHWIVMDRSLMRWFDRIPKAIPGSKDHAQDICDYQNKIL